MSEDTKQQDPKPDMVTLPPDEAVVTITVLKSYVANECPFHGLEPEAVWRIKTEPTPGHENDDAVEMNLAVMTAVGRLLQHIHSQGIVLSCEGEVEKPMAVFAVEGVELPADVTVN